VATVWAEEEEEEKREQKKKLSPHDKEISNRLGADQ